MTTIDRDMFEAALYEAGLDDADIRENYSGRGMYGDTCIGLVCAPSAYTRFVASYAVEALEEQVECDWLDRVRSDNMGLSMIYYWPGVKFS